MGCGDTAFPDTGSRGVFVVLVSLYGNYMLAKGYGKRLFMIEVIKDSAIAIAILATVFYRSVDLLVWGQLCASVATWIVIVWLTGKATGYGVCGMVRDLFPFASAAGVMWCVCKIVSCCFAGVEFTTMMSMLQLGVEVLTGGLCYLAIMWVGRFPELREASGYLFGRFRR